jgi:hypothetical protein
MGWKSKKFRKILTTVVKHSPKIIQLLPPRGIPLRPKDVVKILKTVRP